MVMNFTLPSSITFGTQLLNFIEIRLFPNINSELLRWRDKQVIFLDQAFKLFQVIKPLKGLSNTRNSYSSLSAKYWPRISGFQAEVIFDKRLLVPISLNHFILLLLYPAEAIFFLKYFLSLAPSLSQNV